jgi:hypothetical protein
MRLVGYLKKSISMDGNMNVKYTTVYVMRALIGLIINT